MSTSGWQMWRRKRGEGRGRRRKPSQRVRRIFNHGCSQLTRLRSRESSYVQEAVDGDDVMPSHLSHGYPHYLYLVLIHGGIRTPSTRQSRLLGCCLCEILFTIVRGFRAFHHSPHAGLQPASQTGNASYVGLSRNDRRAGTSWHLTLGPIITHCMQARSLLLTLVSCYS